ncbi:MAG: hypothetical protein ACSLFP_11960 [Acidimicrobiales bacterium]
MSAHTSDPRDDHVGSLQEELAAMLGEHVERQVVEPMRRVASRAPRLGGAAVAPPVELDPAVVDAITLAVDHSIEQLLPGLVEDAIARVLPVALDAAVADIVEALSPTAAPAAVPGARAAAGAAPSATAFDVAERAARSLRGLRRSWGA